MKDKKIVPSGRELSLQEGDLIVSKTDPSGRLTYCNRIFMDLVGYHEAELLGRQHNIIRHPDMPRSVFHLLWETIKQGEEFFGYVKNMSSNGDHYWVLANVTPSYDRTGKLLGYYSVRRKPTGEAVERVAGLYEKMREAERGAGARDAVEAGLAVLQQALAGERYEKFILGI
jgi:PAS domain S-box-containing protein